jgi:hypothetical protein
VKNITMLILSLAVLIAAYNGCRNTRRINEVYLNEAEIYKILTVHGREIERQRNWNSYVVEALGDPNTP